MIDISSWMDSFLQMLEDTFGDRIWFVGLQGSYGRGEATESSDIDTVVILDKLDDEDIRRYKEMLDTLLHRELVCGFISGKNEILNWDAADLFQFYHDTTAIKGSLDELKNMIDNEAVDRAIKIGVCNLYHSCVYNMLRENDEVVLRCLYKTASFIVQAICFKQTGKYYRHQSELLQNAEADEVAIINTFMKMKGSAETDLNKSAEQLFNWCKKWINLL